MNKNGLRIDTVDGNNINIIVFGCVYTVTAPSVDSVREQINLHADGYNRIYAELLGTPSTRRKTLFDVYGGIITGDWMWYTATVSGTYEMYDIAKEITDYVYDNFAAGMFVAGHNIENLFTITVRSIVDAYHCNEEKLIH